MPPSQDSLRSLAAFGGADAVSLARVTHLRSVHRSGAMSERSKDRPSRPGEIVTLHDPSASLTLPANSDGTRA